MNNLPLQPLFWDWSYGDGGKTRAVCRAKSPSHEYIIRMGDKAEVYYVDYRKFENDEDSDNRKDEQPVFGSVGAAQAWAQSTHYPSKMQPYVKPDSITNYFDKFKKWGLDRGIIQNGDTLAQGLKLVSEMGELADNLAKDRCIKDDIGDCMVVLTMLANMTDTPIEDCLAQAWNDIKDRKGTMNEHGVFIKDGDND